MNEEIFGGTYFCFMTSKHTHIEHIQRTIEDVSGLHKWPSSWRKVTQKSFLNKLSICLSFFKYDFLFLFYTFPFLYSSYIPHNLLSSLDSLHFCLTSQKRQWSLQETIELKPEAIRESKSSHTETGQNNTTRARVLRTEKRVRNTPSHTRLTAATNIQRIWCKPMQASISVSQCEPGLVDSVGCILHSL